MKTSGPSTVSVIVPVYVATPALYPVIEHFFASLQENYPDFEIIAVDDASPHPCLSSWPIALRHDSNQGFTATVNTGLDMAQGDILVIANDDLTIKAGDLDRYRKLRDNTIASPCDTSSDDTNHFGAIWGMTRQTYDLLGPLNPAYRHFWSDRDYFDRALAAGVQIVKWRDITIDHEESATYSLVDKQTLLEEDTHLWNQSH